MTSGPGEGSDDEASPALNGRGAQPRLALALPGWPDAPVLPTGSYVVGVLPGEGIGPEVVAGALEVLDAAAARFGHTFEVRHGGAIGADAEARGGRALSEEVVAFCESVFADGGAVLCGPGGGRFVYDLRERFDLFCKFSPLRPWPALADVGVMRPDAVAGVDLLLIRENVGGMYFGEETVQRDERGVREVRHRFRYRREEVERILGVGLEVAALRRRHLTLVVKPGGIEQISALWADTLASLASGTGVSTDVLSIDNAAYQVLARARELDVMVSSNMSGDVLADCAGLLLGSRGMTYSGNFGPGGAAAYQTGHGAAYDLAGRDEANPVAQILSVAMLLGESFGLSAAAAAVERAVAAVLDEGWRTADVAGPESKVVGTREMAARIADMTQTQTGDATVAA